MEVWRGLEGVWGGLGSSLGPSWFEVGLGKRLGQFWTAPGRPRWSQDGPKRRQDGPSWRQDGVKMAKLRRKIANLTLLGGCFWRLFVIREAIFEKIEKV